MSTKIYDAYKVRRRDQLWSVLWKIREQGEANVQERFRKLYWETMTRLNPEVLAGQLVLQPEAEEWQVRLNMVQRELRDEFKLNVTQMTRSFFDIEVNVVVYPHETGFYLRAFCDTASCLAGTLDFMNDMPELSDFHYQNQTDRPEGVSQRAWRNREKIWNSLIRRDGVMTDYVKLEISSWQSFWRLDPWLDLYKEYAKTPPEFPCLEAVYAKDLHGKLPDAVGKPGLITAKNGEVVVKKGKTTFRWFTVIEGRRTWHNSLSGAVEHVKLKHAPKSHQRMVERMIRDAKRRQKVKPDGQRTKV